MRYVSTRGQAPTLDFSQVLLAGLAEDGGLYAPEAYPVLRKADIAALAGLSYERAAERIITPFIGDCLTSADLSAMISAAYRPFGHEAVTPIAQLAPNLFALELFHGPTLAFKDLAMQLLGRLTAQALQGSGRRATVVGATSGDTGAAAIEAFRGLDNVDVFILYPEGRVSDVQRRQMTTLDSPNVHTLAVGGSFDDCQAIVKNLFADASLRKELGLMGVNSINWARIVAQIVYFFVGAVVLGSPLRKISICVPTGNFGDIFAAYIAKRMGLPIERLVIAANENDILVRALESGRYEVRPVAPTQSPSMDIQVSSNFERLLFEASDRDSAQVLAMMKSLRQSGAFSIPEGALRNIRADFDAERVSEAQTTAEIGRVYERNGYVLDPHTAVGVAAARKRLALAPHIPMLVAATAHPAKFPDAVFAACGKKVDLPSSLSALLRRPEKFERVPNDFEAIARLIRSRSKAGRPS